MNPGVGAPCYCQRDALSRIILSMRPSNILVWPIEVIEAEIRDIEGDILRMLAEVTGGGKAIRTG